MNKKSRQNFKYFENEKSFPDEGKVFFIIFKGLSVKQIKKIFWKVRVQLQGLFRSNHSKLFHRISFFKIFGKLTGKLLCYILCFNRVAGLRPPDSNYIVKGPDTVVFL